MALPTAAQRASAAELARKQRVRNLLARDSINAPRLLDELQQIKEKLETCHPDDIQRLTAIAGINFKLLNKVVPDLKSVDVQEEEQTATVINIDKSDYAEARRMMLEQDAC